MFDLPFSSKRLAQACLLTGLVSLSTPAGADGRTWTRWLRPARGTSNVAPRTSLDELNLPRSTLDGFRALPGTVPAMALVRRFGDRNAMAWNLVLDTIASARPGKALKSSFFTTQKDPYGWAYMGGLLHAQMRGVSVTHLNDWSSNSRGRGFVSHGGGQSVLRELVRHGATVGIFNPPLKRLKYLMKHGLGYAAIGCNHDKALVANPGTEDAQGMNGGRNIARAYYQEPSKPFRRRDGTLGTIPGDNDQAWRDDTIQIKGNQACTGLAGAVDRELDGPTMKRLSAPWFGFRSRAREMLAAYALMEEWVSRTPLTTRQKAQVRADPGAQARLAGTVLTAAEKRLETLIAALPPAIRKTIPSRLGWLAARNLKKLARELSHDLELCGTRAAYQKLGGYMKAQVKIIDQTGAASAAPGQRFNEMAPSLRHLIRRAKREVVALNPYVVLTEEMVQAFEEGARHGVKYTILTNSPLSTDSAITQGYFLNSWANVLARVPTMRIFVATGKRKMHAKAFVVDGVLSGDTTYNADLLSGHVNGELGTLSLSRRFAADLSKDIAHDLANPANAFKEWTIKKDARGRAVLDEKGRPIALQGPKTDLSWKLRALYTPVRWLCKALALTKHGAPLQLRQAKDVLPGRAF